MKKTRKAPARKKGPKSENLATKVRDYLRAKESGKRGYQRADRLLQEIAHRSSPGREIPLDHRGRKAILRDRFADKSIVWQPCAARRWELEIVEP